LAARRAARVKDIISRLRPLKPDLNGIFQRAPIRAGRADAFGVNRAANAPGIEFLKYQYIMRKRENHNTLSLKKESKMKPHKGGLFSLGRCSHWLTLLALLLLSALPAPLAAGAAPAAASIPTGQSQRIEAGQTPAGLSAADWASIQAQIEAGPYLKASNTGAGDQFGRSVAVWGDTAVVGAYLEASSATVVNGDEDNDSASMAGAAYVFVRSSGVWSQQAYLKASNTEAGDIFGFSVAISGDTIVVGAPWESSSATGVGGDESDNSASMAGAAYVFVRSGGNWGQQAYLKASNTEAGDWFGASVAISGDTVVVGAYLEASSASDAGAAYVFVRSSGDWSQQAYLKASNTGAVDYFGVSVAISGDTVVVGAPLEDSSATGVDGDGDDNSVPDAGAAYVFLRSGGNWSQQAYLKASNTGAGDNFGWSVAISGDTVVVGAPWEDSSATGVNGNGDGNSATNAGAAYVFGRSGGVWSQQAYLKASNTGMGDFFGASVAVAGEAVVVGAPYEDSSATGVNGDGGDDSASLAGAAYVFLRSRGVWRQQAYLKASNTGAGDSFGVSVATSGGTVVVGAYYEASSATGVNGDGSDNSASNAGAAYVFKTINTLYLPRVIRNAP